MDLTEREVTLIVALAGLASPIVTLAVTRWAEARKERESTTARLHEARAAKRVEIRATYLVQLQERASAMQAEFLEALLASTFIREGDHTALGQVAAHHARAEELRVEVGRLAFHLSDPDLLANYHELMQACVTLSHLASESVGGRVPEQRYRDAYKQLEQARVPFNARIETLLCGADLDRVLTRSSRPAAGP